MVNKAEMANARPFAVLPWVLRCLEGRFYKKKSQRAGCGHWRSRAVRYISDYFTCAIIPDADLRAVRLRVKARLTPPDPPALRLRVKARLTPVTRASRPRAPRRSGAAAGPMEHAAHGPAVRGAPAGPGGDRGARADHRRRGRTRRVAGRPLRRRCFVKPTGKMAPRMH